MAAIDGIGKDFIIGKNQVIILPTIGKEKRVNYTDITRVQYRIATWQLVGEITISTKFGEKFSATFRKSQNDNFKQVLQLLEDSLENTEFLLLEAPESLGSMNVKKELSQATTIEEKELVMQKATLLEQQKANKLQQKQFKAMAKCPKCGSTSLSSQKKGYGVVKGGLGGLAGGMLGPVGAVVGLGAGNIGRKKVWVTCLNCGHRFKL